MSISNTGGMKATKPQRYDLIPLEPLKLLAQHYGVGATKYADHNWKLGFEWSKSYAALMRHLTAFWGGEDVDEETGSLHMTAVAWHAFTLLEFMQDHPEFDDRWSTKQKKSKFAKGGVIKTPATSIKPNEFVVTINNPPAEEGAISVQRGIKLVKNLGFLA